MLAPPLNREYATVPNLNVAVPPSLDSALKHAAAERASSVDSIVVAALSQYFQTDRHRAYEISTAAALVEGVSEGAISSKTLLANGNFGLGTFDRLDGEMVVLDGGIYQVRGDGTVRLRQDNFLVPFAVVTRFQPDQSFACGPISQLKDLEHACDPYRESQNLFYALRVDAIFDRIHTRAVAPSPVGTKLIDAAKVQPEFRFTNAEGTLVGFWAPFYSRSFNIPGYHFHFLSKDRSKGGHVLDCSAKRLQVGIQMLSEYDVRLPESGAFLKVSLDRDTAGDLKKAE
jgi:acetolactate decarboxylase